MATRSPMPSGRHLVRALTPNTRKSITFAGKLFYLDLSHSKQTQLLTKTICSLGGVIESFLSRDVNYVVTGNKKAADIGYEDSCKRKGSSSQCPATEKTEKTPYSRGKQLLKKVVQTQECNSILSSARSWGVCILHIDEVLDYLEWSTKRRASKSTAGKRSGCARQTLKVAKLKVPFLKVEDQSRQYCPIHCSFSNFPECSFISSDGSPFETARQNSTHKHKDNRIKQEGEKPKYWEKSGYCECCRVTYTKLSEHLISEQHCLFALNASNYKVVDDITSHIICDLIPLPDGFKPGEEKCEAPPQSVTKEVYLEEEKHRQGESKEHPMDHSVELPKEEQNLLSSERPHVKQGAAYPLESCSLSFSKNPQVNNMVIDPPQEHAGSLVENVLANDSEPQCTVRTKALVQCNLPLVDDTETGEASGVGLVTEVSWYTEETGMTSVYTVQSLGIPPAPAPDQHPELVRDNASEQPSLFLNALGDGLPTLAHGGVSRSSNETVQGDHIAVAHTEPEMVNAAPHQTNDLLPDEPQVTLSAGLFTKPSPVPAAGSKCTLPHLDTATGAESAIDPQPLLLGNALCELQADLSYKLSIDKEMLLYPVEDGHVTVSPSTEPLDNVVDAQNLEPSLSKTDWSGGKRKPCWTPCHPPAKRQPLHCPPMPMWVFHQLPSARNQPSIPIFSDWVDRDCSNKVTKGEGSAPKLYFNPKLVQYDSSESDWDSQLVSQCHTKPQQPAHLGELRNAHASVDENCYGKRLCSLLDDEQSLGSPRTTQTVALSHMSYDLYLGGVPS